jgi:plasmid stabilization system protein ParE
VAPDVASSSKARTDLDALFGGAKNAAAPSAAERAKAELDKLFKK